MYHSAPFPTHRASIIVLTCQTCLWVCGCGCTSFSNPQHVQYASPVFSNTPSWHGFLQTPPFFSNTPSLLFSPPPSLFLSPPLPSPSPNNPSPQIPPSFLQPGQPPPSLHPSLLQPPFPFSFFKSHPGVQPPFLTMWLSL